MKIIKGAMGSIHIIKPPLTMDNNLRRLTTIKRRRNLSMLLLTLVTSSGGLTLARSRTTTSSNALVVGALCIGERGQDVRVPALLLEGLGKEESGEEISRCRRRRRHWPLPLEGQQLEPGRHGVWCGVMVLVDGDGDGGGSSADKDLSFSEVAGFSA